MKILNPEFKRKSVGRTNPRTPTQYTPSSRSTTFRREFDINDLLNIELVNDNLKKFDEAWENILMALEKAQEDDLLENLCRQLEKSTSVPYRSIVPTRLTAKSRRAT